MDTPLIIIQARTSSARLPNKVLRKIKGRPLLSHLIDRLKSSRLFDDNIVVATTDLPTDVKICKLAQQENVKYFRGDTDNVLKRFVDTAKHFNFHGDIIIRITADNPLTDVECMETAFKEVKENKMDYAVVTGLPYGAASEVFTYRALKIAGANAVSEYDKEHVTPFIYNHPEMFHLVFIPAPQELGHPEIRITVDTKQDLQIMRKIFSRLYKVKNDFPLREVISLYQ